VAGADDNRIVVPVRVQLGPLLEETLAATVAVVRLGLALSSPRRRC
jgi:hypothetical protein